MEVNPGLLKPGLIGEAIKRDLKGRFIQDHNPRPWLRKIPEGQTKEIQHLYLEELRSLSWIAGRYGCNLETIRQFLICHQIPVRSVEEGIRLIANSTELREKRSLNSQGERNPNFGKPAAHGTGFGRTGIRIDLNQYFRSSWEANIARLLNYYGIDWKWEPQTFILKNLSYTPDFLIYDKIYLEVKGKFLKDAAEKIKRFRERYPEKSFILIDSKIYRQLERVYHRIIPNWEYR